MFKVRSEARCPNNYYEELLMDLNKFDKMTKMQLVAFINVNSNEDEQVTLRPRKSTLVRIAKKIAVSQSTKAGCSGWYEKHDSDIAVLNKMAEEACDPKKGEGLLAFLMKYLTLVGVFGFFAIIALEFVSFWSDLPLGHLVGIIMVLVLIIGIPIKVLLWEKKYNG